MDAKNVAPALCALTLMLGGCLEPAVGPTLRQPEPKPPPAKPERAIVQTRPEPPPAPAADDSELVGERVRNYIEQVDTISQRVSRDGVTVSRVADVGLPPPRRESPPLPPAVLTESAQPAAPSVAAQPAPEPAPPTAPAPQAPASPPVLASVAVRERPAANAPEPARTAPESPSPNAPTAASQAPIALEQFLKQWPADAADSSFRQQLDLRILRAMAGDYEAAREPFTVICAEQQAMGARLIDSLIAIRQAHDGDLTGAIADVLTNVDGLRDVLRPLAELRIPAIVLCREVRGFGDYVPIEPPSFPAGAATEFVLYCEVQNFISRPEEDHLYHARFEMCTTILNRAGDAVLEIRDADVVDACRNRRNDCFIPRLVRLPATLSPGEYVAKVTVVDKLGDKLAESRTGFRVVAGR